MPALAGQNPSTIQVKEVRASVEPSKNRHQARRPKADMNGNARKCSENPIFLPGRPIWRVKLSTPQMVTNRLEVAAVDSGNTVQSHNSRCPWFAGTHQSRITLSFPHRREYKPPSPGAPDSLRGAMKGASHSSRRSVTRANPHPHMAVRTGLRCRCQLRADFVIG